MNELRLRIFSNTSQKFDTQTYLVITQLLCISMQICGSIYAGTNLLQTSNERK